jgi:hypothetical protein
MMAQQRIPLRLHLHAFGDDRQSQVLAEGDNHLDDCGVAGVAEDVPDKTLIDFQLVQRQPLEIGEGRKTRSEIVQRETHTCRIQHRHPGHDVIDVRYQHALGQFEFQ